MKTRQFCSVCKKHLDMEIVPTGDGDDDGVVWFRCPECQGFLPKLGGALDEEDDTASVAADASGDDQAATATPEDASPPSPPAGDEDMPWDSPADMIAARSAGDGAPDPGGDTAPTAEKAKDEGAAPEEPAEPLAEYAAQLAGLDPATAAPYRPWQEYEVGQCVHHLAWDDCGVVVAKEELPGGRRVIKCYFSEAGVVRLIEQAPR